VRWRFLYAQQLLRRGRAVLMHDADVFFRPGGLLAVARWANATGREDLDFAVQHNGGRKEAYDDLNWGFVWMSGSPFSVRFLGCTLGVWTHKVFSPPPDRPHMPYYARSQPRINHVFEAAVETAPTAAAVPRLCTFRPAFLARTIRHLSGYTSARQKLMCARAEGILDDDPARARPRLLYEVPLNATVDEQKRALVAALALAQASRLAVAIPAASFAGRRVPFCRLFDVDALPPQRMTRAWHAAMLKEQCVGALGTADVLAQGKAAAADAEKGQGSSAVAARDRSSRAAMPPAQCVGFASLLAWDGGTMGPTTHLLRRLRTCDPMDKRVVSVHACYAAAHAPNKSAA